jgi:multiple sugar transport system permease protein
VVKRELGPLPWLIACLFLVFEVVLRPIYVLFQTSRQDISRAGIARGSVGWDNFTRLFDDPDFTPVLVRTAVWVVVVVAVTLAISLPLAQFLDKPFPGRRFVRYALLVPWAASVLMTALSFRWMLQPFFGVVNQTLLDLNLIDERIDFLAKPSTAFPAMIFVAIFVSVPFTTYVALAGLQTVPGELYEAAAIDGASPWKRYTNITLPLLRPAILVAVLINIINVFNSFPIIWAMTEGGPQFDTSTSTVFMYKLAVQNRQLDTSAAMAVVNLGLVFVVVLIFLRASRWQEASRAS